MRVMRVLTPMLVLVLTIAGAGCGSSSGASDDMTVADTPDVPADVPADLPGDVPASDADDIADTPAADADVLIGIDDGPAPKALPEILATSLQNVLEEYLAFSGDPGVSAALRLGDGGTWTGVAGVMDTTTKVAMTPDVGFRVGSNTKPYIVALVMALKEEGKVDLDAPLTTYLPEYPNWSAVTVRMLMGMQSGIADYMWVSDFMIAAVFNPASLAGPADLLAYVKDTPMTFTPGEGCEYCNTNYVLLGMIAEKTGGQPPEVALKERFFDRLGLKSTYLDVAGDETATLSHGYVDVGIVGLQFGLGADAIGMIPAEWFQHDLYMDATYTFPPMFSWTAGMLVTTPTEAVTFLREMLRGRLISPASVVEMQTTHPCLLLGSQVEYGLGLSTSITGPFTRSWGHGGMNFGYEANTIHFPAEDITLSHMHNQLPEQSWQFQAMFMDRLREGADAAVYPACLLPEGFFAGTGDRVELRVRGVIDAIDTVIDIRGTLNGADTPLYGFGTSAKRVGDAGAERLEITSTAPSVTKGVSQRKVVLSIDAAQLAGKDGALILDTAGTDAMRMTVSELVIDPTGVVPTTGCVVAVPVPTGSAKIHLCGGTSFNAAAGDLLKIFADVPVTTDVEAIDLYLAAEGQTRCF
jgi:D-alanyl-D-alanine carboxypeptidase